MLAKVKTSIIILLILLSAFLWAAKPTQAMRRESFDQPAPIEILEGRSVIVNIPGRNSHTFILEV